MKKAIRFFSVLSAVFLMLSASMACLAAERDIYTYTVAGTIQSIWRMTGSW